MEDKWIPLQQRVGYRTPDLNLDPPDDPELDKDGNEIEYCPDCGMPNDRCRCSEEDE
jgi:hypothetical protein